MFFNRFFIVVFLVGMFFSQGKVDGVAAIVGNSVILHSDVLQQSQFVAMERRVDPSKNPYLFEQIYVSTLNNIINQYAVLSVAEKDTNIIISNDEVDRALNQQIDDFILKAGSEKLFLEMAGMSMRQIKADYWQDIRDMMILERYQYSKIQNVDVSRVEVLHFFDSFKDSIPRHPEKYNFSIIEVPFSPGDASMAKAFDFLNMLKDEVQTNGVSFDSLAQLYSHDPGSAPAGGRLGFTHRGALVREYEEVSYAMEVGEISDPVKSDFGYHLIKLIDRRGEKISTQHILRTIEFSEDDRINAYDAIYDIYTHTNNNSPAFDSLSNIFSTKYKNGSGKYSDFPASHIPEYLFVALKNMDIGELSMPIEMGGGYFLVYYYDHQKEFVPDLDNSWGLIYEYAKQEKQNSTFSDLVKNIKANIYINILNN